MRGASAQDVDAALAKRYGARKDAYVQAFQKAYPKYTAPEYMVQVDTIFRPGVVQQATARAQAKAAPVFVYLFAWEAPVLDGMFKSMHCLEIPFVFNSIDYAQYHTGAGPEAYALAAKVSKAWVQFARPAIPITRPADVARVHAGERRDDGDRQQERGPQPPRQGVARGDWAVGRVGERRTCATAQGESGGFRSFSRQCPRRGPGTATSTACAGRSGTGCPGARGGMRGGPPVVSPRSSLNGRVTFRMLAPNAAAVTVVATSTARWCPTAPAKPAPAVTMTKGENGVWSGTNAARGEAGAWALHLQPGRRAIVADRANVRLSPNQTQPQSLLVVPGDFSGDARRAARQREPGPLRGEGARQRPPRDVRLHAARYEKSTRVTRCST